MVEQVKHWGRSASVMCDPVEILVVSYQRGLSCLHGPGYLGVTTVSHCAVGEGLRCHDEKGSSFFVLLPILCGVRS